MVRELINELLLSRPTTIELSAFFVNHAQDLKFFCAHSTQEDWDLYRRLVGHITFHGHYPLNLVDLVPMNTPIDHISALPFLYVHHDALLAFTTPEVDKLTGVDAVNIHGGGKFQFKFRDRIMETSPYGTDVKISYLVESSPAKQRALDRGYMAMTTEELRATPIGKLEAINVKYNLLRDSYGEKHARIMDQMINVRRNDH